MSDSRPFPETGPGYWSAMLPAGSVDNAGIAAAFHRHRDSARCTHLFGGRYENIYIDLELVPALKPVLDEVGRIASRILDIPAEKLRSGFWFNCMEPGHSTLPHCHDDYDEMLSAVYYIDVPENSGALMLDVEGGRVVVEPEAGKCVLFRPELVHEVGENLSDRMRLSIGINITVLD